MTRISKSLDLFLGTGMRSNRPKRLKPTLRLTFGRYFEFYSEFFRPFISRFFYGHISQIIIIQSFLIPGVSVSPSANRQSTGTPINLSTGLAIQVLELFFVCFFNKRFLKQTKSGNGS